MNKQVIDNVNAFIDVFHFPAVHDGVLSGLTVGVKDLIDVQGKITGCGNPDWARTHPAAGRHADSVDTLLNNGACLLGKTHTDELAYSLLGINSHYGTPLNSAAPDRIPGGSSSGSAAAVAAELVDIGLGTDTGGSIRVPAAFCGLYGLRTTHGFISLRGVMPLAPSFDTIGWLTRNPDLLFKLLQAFEFPMVNADADTVTKLIIPEDLWEKADESIRNVLLPFIDAATALFGNCSYVSLASEGLGTWREVFQVCQAAEIWSCHGRWIEEQSPTFGPGVRERFIKASAITEKERDHAETTRKSIRERIFGLLRGGVILTPAVPSTPLPRRGVGGKELETFRDRALEMLCPAGLAGLPQLVFPARSLDGAPVGLSLIGMPGSEYLLHVLAQKVSGRCNS